MVSLKENRKGMARFQIFDHHIHDAIVAIYSRLIGLVFFQIADQFEPSVPGSCVPESPEIEDCNALP
jgi:hypothetical protein